MQVVDLQQFVRNLGTTVGAAGAKKIGDDLERVAAGFEPFKHMPVAQFGEFLAKAEEYARTGIVPTAKGRAKASKAPKPDSATKVRDAAQKVLALYERAVDPELQFAAISAEIKSIEKLTKDELVQVAREVGISKTLKTKKDALAELERKVTERKESFQRIQFGGEKAAEQREPQAAAAKE